MRSSPPSRRQNRNTAALSTPRQPSQLPGIRHDPAQTSSLSVFNPSPHPFPSRTARTVRTRPAMTAVPHVVVPVLHRERVQTGQALPPEDFPPPPQLKTPPPQPFLARRTQRRHPPGLPGHLQVRRQDVSRPRQPSVTKPQLLPDQVVGDERIMDHGLLPRFRLSAIVRLPVTPRPPLPVTMTTRVAIRAPRAWFSSRDSSTTSVGAPTFPPTPNSASNTKTATVVLTAKKPLP